MNHFYEGRISITVLVITIKDRIVKALSKFYVSIVNMSFVRKMISVSKDTHTKLAALGIKDQSFDSIIKKLLEQTTGTRGNN